MNAQDLDQIDNLLITNPSRELLIEIAQNGINLPSFAKAAVMIAIQTMTEEQIKTYAEVAHNALVFVKNKDMEGLTGYLGKVGIPAPMLQVLRNYATNNPKN